MGGVTCEWQVPEVIPVFAQLYTVEIKKKISDDDSDWGACDSQKKVFEFVREFPTASTFLIAYFHEILHAVEQEVRAKDLGRDHELDLAAHAIVQALCALLDAQGDDE